MVDDTVEESGKGASVAESPRMDGIKHISEGRVELVVLVQVSMTEVFDIFGEVTKEKDVVLADFACNFDLAKLAKSLTWISVANPHICTIAGSDDKASVQAEFHVARSRCLGTSGRNVL
jgi:hypothetical protein